MKEFIEKLIGRLEEKIVNLTFDESIKTKNYAYKNAIEIVNKLTEEYNNGWTPCSERLPEPGKRYLVSCIVKTGDIEEYTVWHAIYAGSRGWYADNGKSLNAEIIAWQYLPEPYKPHQKSEWKNKVMKHFTNVE